MRDRRRRRALAVESLVASGRTGGRITLTASLHGDDHAAITVADNGPGLPAAAREKVFEPFVSGKPTGMGLGLAVSRAIAEAHGGSLTAQPVPGRGTTFRVALPAIANA